MDIIEEEKVLVQTDSTDEKFVFANDPNTLRVRGGEYNPEFPDKKPTDPYGLCKAILHVLGKGEYVKILSVGPIAEKIVMKAFRLASNEAESRTNGAVLVCRQSEYEAIVANRTTKGVSTRIFAIPIKYAL